MRKQENYAGDDEFNLVLKPMGRIIRSPKQRVPVAPYNGNLSPHKEKLNNLFDDKHLQTRDQTEKDIFTCCIYVLYLISISIKINAVFIRIEAPSPIEAPLPFLGKKYIKYL